MNNFKQTCCEFKSELGRELSNKEIDFLIWLSDCQQEDTQPVYNHSDKHTMTLY